MKNNKELNNVRKMIQDAKRKFNIAIQAERDVFEHLLELNIDLEATVKNAENSDNLEEAITCYFSYNEVGIELIMEAIEEQYNSK